MRTLLCSLLSIVLASAGHGALVIYNANLEGSQEVGPVVTGGSGSATLSVETTNGNWSLTGSFINLNGNSTVSHIHGPAPVGANGVVTAGGTLTITTAGNTFGSLSGGGTFDAGQMASLSAGLFYVNVHSAPHPGGELRGQLIPESSAGLLAALGAVALLRRRRAEVSVP